MIDYRGKKVMIGLSAGINSMAVLCWLAHYEYKPEDIWIFYAHFKEHSPDSEAFVLSGVEYAKNHFKTVHYKQTNNSVLEFFKSQNMIPHPMFSPCTRMLKIIPMAEFAAENNVTVDLVGYVRTEMRRVKGNTGSNLFLSKEFPILFMSDDDCFDLVDKEIGWHPAIYDIRDENGKRVFAHNNCLPCKNFNLKDMKNTQVYYPDYWQEAMNLSGELERHWGRNGDEFYKTFLRDDLSYGHCEICAF